MDLAYMRWKADACILHKALMAATDIPFFLDFDGHANCKIMQVTGHQYDVAELERLVEVAKQIKLSTKYVIEVALHQGEVPAAEDYL